MGTDETGAKSTLEEDDIGELRKYIVEMMHAEIELLESIKLKERNLAAVTAQIKQYKELIVQERIRYKMLRKELEGCASELSSLEEKKNVAEIKHQQFRDAVTQREGEVQRLCAQFQHQHSAMLSLKRQILVTAARLQTLFSMEASAEYQALNIAATMNECTEPMSQRSARQQIHAGISYTQQLIVQLEDEISQLVDKRVMIEADLLKCEQEVNKMRGLIMDKEKEVDNLFCRLLKDTKSVIHSNDKLEGKLKTKRRKFQLKTKNEINSLKRKISSITSELEKGQMTNEDTLSNIGTLSIKREELETRLGLRNEQVIAVENAIAVISSALATTSQVERNSCTQYLREEMAAKRSDAEVAKKKLEEKQNLLTKLKEDQTKLNTVFEDTAAQIVGATRATEALDNEIASLAKDIEDEEERHNNSSTQVTDAEREYSAIQARIQDHERLISNVVNNQTKLRQQKASLVKQKDEMTSRLHEAKDLNGVLAEGIKYGTEYAQELVESNAHIEFELRRQELSLQQQCAQEESKLEAEVTAWDKKIKLVEHQLLIRNANFS